MIVLIIQDYREKLQKNMVSVKEAINSGSWLICEYKYDPKYDDESIKFRLKINSFRKVNFSEIDKPQKIENLGSNGILWIMNIEIINLTKSPQEIYKIPDSLILVDQDDFNFPQIDGDHLRYYSNFSKTSGLSKFYITGEKLIPKIKMEGSIIFQVPDDDDAEYSISINNDGIVQEV